MFIHLMKEFAVPRYQFVQTSGREVELRTRRRDGLDERLRERIRAAYRPHLPDGVRLAFSEVDEFERTTTGKFRFVFRDIREPG